MKGVNAAFDTIHRFLMEALFKGAITLSNILKNTFLHAMELETFPNLPAIFFPSPEPALDQIKIRPGTQKILIA
jgi:hypothetical protein